MSQTRKASTDTLTLEQREFLAGSHVAKSDAASPEASDEEPEALRADRPRTEPRRATTNTDTELTCSGRISRQPVTVRLAADVTERLRRVCAERSITYDEPRSQQGIVEDALRKWLRRHGYS